MSYHGLNLDTVKAVKSSLQDGGRTWYYEDALDRKMVLLDR